jgi:hypothetical protein
LKTKTKYDFSPVLELVPEVKEIKQTIRDQLDPDMDLGRSDTQEMAQARKLFGVE